MRNVFKLDGTFGTNLECSQGIRTIRTCPIHHMKGGMLVKNGGPFLVKTDTSGRHNQI